MINEKNVTDIENKEDVHRENNKFENYWGNIIVNYIDNKRMNYVGFVTNNDKKEFIDYTYENTNN